MGVHDGHRERMKQRFAAHGLDSFDDHNVLELLLFFARPRCDTNEIAHALMNRFDTLDGVFEASIEELRKVDGVGGTTALLLHLIPQVSRRYMMAKNTAGTVVLSSTEEAGKFLVPLFMYEREEVVYMVCMDSMCRMICYREIGRGVVNEAEVSVRRIVEIALAHGAVSVILAHNHTNGLALPSREDEATTRHVRSALRLVGIQLTDHIIVAGNDFVSMADSDILSRL